MGLKKFKNYWILIIVTQYYTNTVAQSMIELNKIDKNAIVYQDEQTQKAAQILKDNLNKIVTNNFVIDKNFRNSLAKIALSINESLEENTFKIYSDDKSIHLEASSSKFLRYSVYTLLEFWGFRKFTSKIMYIPEGKKLIFPKKYSKTYKPAFDYRALFYPDAYDEDFRDWHKLDWHINDFGSWGHTFSKLLLPKEYFKTHPEYFALYENNRREESFCMTNETVFNIVVQNLKKSIQDNPAQFYSVSQNDDVIYCECSKCSVLNKKHGGPQGSLYTFINKIAEKFPKTKIVTLAYLHTYKPPINLKIRPNVYTLFCPIDENRGKSFLTEKNPSFMNPLKGWKETASNLFVWDYTVQFSNYMSPFPSMHTFQENYKLLKENKVKGIFAQGYADVPGDFSELRQYLLAKLIWDTDIDIDQTTNDFLRGFYGKSAPFIKNYIDALTQNQLVGNQFLDIYSGPLQCRKTFLSTENMDQYDKILDKAEAIEKKSSEILTRIKKLRLALEFVYFEQSKFYGKDKHGMFLVDPKGIKTVKKGLTERVKQFADGCQALGIYELSEGGLSPKQYYDEWLEICKNTTTHLGENLTVNFITQPEKDYEGKGSYSLVDGVRGYHDYNINWIGWYDKDPEIELITNNLDFKKAKINFLEDQRHWIFRPKRIIISGFTNNKWKTITEYNFNDIEEDYKVSITPWESGVFDFKNYSKIKIRIINREKLPLWRYRKNKKSMIMIDEVELY
jgi:Domain of unknown function (DUF4838)